MSMCVACGCSNRNGMKPPPGKQKVTFHRFPKDEEIKEKWIKALRRANWKPTPYSYLCSEHFVGSDFDKSSPFRVYLKKNSVPSVFPTFPKHLKPSTSKETNVELSMKNESNTTHYSEYDGPCQSSISDYEKTAQPDTNYFECASYEDSSKEFYPELDESSPSSSSRPEKRPPPPASNEQGTAKIRKIAAKTCCCTSQVPEDEFSIAGKKYASDLRALDPEQRVFVEKLMGDLIFYAKRNKLNDLSTVHIQGTSQSERSSNSIHSTNIGSSTVYIKEEVADDISD